jgi:hypothetical protein
MLRVQHHTPRLAIADKNFAAAQNVSHIGLGVSATQNAKALRAAGYIVEIWPIRSFADLQTLMKAEVQARTLSASHTAFPSGDQRALDSDNQLGQPDVSESRPGNCRGQPQQHRIPASRSWCDRIVASGLGTGAGLSQLPHCGQLAGLSDLVAVDLRESSFEP